MKKKTKLIILLIIVIIAVIVIPIAIYASKTISVHFPTDKEIEEANIQEKNNALAKKEEFAKNNISNENITSKYETAEVQKGDDPFINEQIAQLKEEDAKRVAIIKKFYPEEYEDILEESKNEQDTGIVEITKSPLKNYEKRLYDLTLRILEEEKLTDDEYELLKEDIKISMDSIEKDEGLLKRAEKILDNEKTK